MTDYERIKQKLERTPFLVANEATVKVSLENDATVQRIMKTDSANMIINLRAALENFVKLPAIGKDDREFGLKEIAECLGITYHLADYYVRQGVIGPSNRRASGSGTGKSEARFSWADAFAAGAVGSMMRIGLKREILAEVQPLLRKAQKKQTASPLVTAKRS